MQPPLHSAVAVAVTLLLWSSAFVAIRHLGQHFSPGALSLGRLLVGSVALGAVLADARLDDTDAPRVAGPGGDRRLLWFGVYNVALNAGERRVDAGTAAMLIQLSPSWWPCWPRCSSRSGPPRCWASACSSRSRAWC